MNRYEREIGEAAIRTFGIIPNIIKAVEELAELQQALCKYIVAPNDAMIVENVHEEIAAVEIMLNRLKMMFDPTEVEEWKGRKLEKTARLLGMDEAKGDRCSRCGPCAVCEGPEEPTGDVLKEMRL